MQHLECKRALGLIAVTSLILVWSATLEADEKVEDRNDDGNIEASDQVISTDTSAVWIPPSTVVDFSGEWRPVEPVPLACSARANCDNGTSVTCTGACPSNMKPGSCSPNGRVRGWVSCGSVKKYCSPCPACTHDDSCNFRSCSSDNDCHNGTCPNGSCFNGTCLCPTAD